MQTPLLDHGRSCSPGRPWESGVGLAAGRHPCRSPESPQSVSRPRGGQGMRQRQRGHDAQPEAAAQAPFEQAALAWGRSSVCMASRSSSCWVWRPMRMAITGYRAGGAADRPRRGRRPRWRGRSRYRQRSWRVPLLVKAIGLTRRVPVATAIEPFVHLQMHNPVRMPRLPLSLPLAHRGSVHMSICWPRQITSQTKWLAGLDSDGRRIYRGAC